MDMDKRVVRLVEVNEHCLRSLFALHDEEICLVEIGYEHFSFIWL
jgi:hypothetical protein